MSETPAEELYLRGYRPASKTWSGLVRWLPVSLPAEDDVRYIRADLHDAQAAEIELLKRVARETALQHHNWNQRNASLIGEQAAEIERLREQSETTRKRERANEDQLVRIASHLGGDATNAPESDRTIAGFAIAEIERLKTLLAYSRLPPHKQWETGWP